MTTCNQFLWSGKTPTKLHTFLARSACGHNIKALGVDEFMGCLICRPNSPIKKFTWTICTDPECDICTDFEVCARVYTLVGVLKFRNAPRYIIRSLSSGVGFDPVDNIENMRNLIIDASDDI